MIAVKPGDVEAACRALAAEGSRSPVLSIAAGVTIARLEEALAPETPVVRAMPNTPALVGPGAPPSPPAPRRRRRRGVGRVDPRAVGTVVRVPRTLLDAVTGLSGSGPAYVFLVAEALIEAGVLAGLPRPVSERWPPRRCSAPPRSWPPPTGAEALRAAVTSPAGTTAAGLRALEQRGMRSAILDAVVAATDAVVSWGTGHVSSHDRPTSQERTASPSGWRGVFRTMGMSAPVPTRRTRWPTTCVCPR